MLVVDTSAVVEFLISTGPDPGLVARVGADGDLHAPHLIDVEFLAALRGLVRSGQISPDRAADARTDFADLPLTRYPHELLADRCWELRDNVTAYDAMYIALAEETGAVLVTCDAKLGKAPGLGAVVEVFAAG